MYSQHRASRKGWAATAAAAATAGAATAHGRRRRQQLRQWQQQRQQQQHGGTGGNSGSGSNCGGSSSSGSTAAAAATTAATTATAAAAIVATTTAVDHSLSWSGILSSTLVGASQPLQLLEPNTPTFKTKGFAPLLGRVGIIQESNSKKAFWHNPEMPFAFFATARTPTPLSPLVHLHRHHQHQKLPPHVAPRYAPSPQSSL